MKRIILIFCIFVMCTFQVFAEGNTFNVGVSIEELPKTFFGCWRVTAKLDDTNSYRTFKPQSVDMWSLSRNGNIITLYNNFTGAKADIKLNAVEGNLVVFTKKGAYDNKILTDTVSIRIDKNTFSGINTLTLESFSLIDNHLMKTETARYIIKGEKISGENFLQDSVK